MSRFSEEDLAKLERANTVRIETRSAKGSVHEVPIWIVVAGGEPYVRSVRGERGRWYRELLARKEGAVHVHGVRLAVRPARVRSDEIIGAVSDALRRKYAKGPSLDSMVVGVVLPTTLRLVPLR